MMKNLIKITFIATVITGFNINNLCSQPTISAEKRAKIDSLKKIDYLSYNYKYLNDDYSFNISSRIFQKTINKYNFYTERINQYKDSLQVVLMAEFNDYNQTTIAHHRITYSWLRLSYSTWENENEIQSFSKTFDITHPWKMYEFLIDESNIDQRIDCFYTNLKGKLTQNNLSGFEEINRKKLLSFAMKNNPQRIADWQKLQAERKKQREAYQKEHGEVDPSKLVIGCGKENCCQKKSKK